MLPYTILGTELEFVKPYGMIPNDALERLVQEEYVYFL